MSSVWWLADRKDPAEQQDHPRITISSPALAQHTSARTAISPICGGHIARGVSVDARWARWLARLG
jgi:hypothetical protein